MDRRSRWPAFRGWAPCLPAPAGTPAQTRRSQGRRATPSLYPPSLCADCPCTPPRPGVEGSRRQGRSAIPHRDPRRPLAGGIWLPPAPQPGPGVSPPQPVPVRRRTSLRCVKAPVCGPSTHAPGPPPTRHRGGLSRGRCRDRRGSARPRPEGQSPETPARKKPPHPPRGWSLSRRTRFRQPQTRPRSPAWRALALSAKGVRPPARAGRRLVGASVPYRAHGLRAAPGRQPKPDARSHDPDPKCRAVAMVFCPLLLAAFLAGLLARLRPLPPSGSISTLPCRHARGRAHAGIQPCSGRCRAPDRPVRLGAPRSRVSGSGAS